MGYVLDNIQMVGFSGLGLGNARYIWTIDGVTTSNLSTIDIGNMTGLNMHSAIFNYLVELSILGVFIFYFISIYIYIQSSKIKTDSVFILRLLLLFFMIDSLVNDDITTLGSPGVIFYILILSILYGKIKYSKRKIKHESYN